MRTLFIQCAWCENPKVKVDTKLSFKGVDVFYHNCVKCNNMTIFDDNYNLIKYIPK